MILELVKPSNRILITPTDEVSSFSEIVNVVQNLKETMVHYNVMVLTGPQVGLSNQILVYGDGENIENTGVLINPKLITHSENMTQSAESCLTFPGVYLTINRYDMIRVRYQDVEGTVHTRRFEGLTSRLIQQGLDQLNGEVFLSKVSKLKLDMAMRKYKKTMKRLGHGRIQTQA